MNDRKRKMNILEELKCMLKNIHIGNETEVDPASAATINVTIELCQEKQCKIDLRHVLQLECVMYRAKEHVNTGKWSEIDIRRRIITVLSYLRLLVLITMNPNPVNNTICEGFKIIDDGLLFGKPVPECPELLHLCADILKKYYTPGGKTIAYPSEKIINLPTEIYGASIDELDCPSLEFFSQNYLKKGLPVIIKKCMNHWPAVTLWQDLNYFIHVAGARTVPVEIGAKYTDENWTQKIMTMKDFIYNYIVTNNMDKGYLAQHQLFNQLPELRSDIKEPEYCCLAETDQGVDMNAWFGPKGTVSPLHFDPKQNFLSQTDPFYVKSGNKLPHQYLQTSHASHGAIENVIVNELFITCGSYHYLSPNYARHKKVVGEKLVILYGPEDSPNLYAHGDNLSNTSRVNPKNPKFEDFPEFRKATPYSCILKPGDMLFIPQKWWHYVESRTISFSVSFWWL